MPGTGDDKVLVVSGGSRGLGLAIVRDSLERRVRVATFARSATPAMDELARAHPGTFRFSSVDARDADAVEGFVRSVVEAFGRIDLLVNNAAIGQDHLLLHMSAELIRSVIETNVTAPILLTRSVLKHMVLQGTGRVVNISSICGLRGFAGLTVYSATKGAMDAFTRAVAREYGPRGVLANSIAPGFFASEMSSVLPQEQLETIRRRTPLGRLIDEEELLPVVAMLLYESSGCTGQTIVVDGGIST